MQTPRTITTLDAHAGGEPLRLITSGVPALKGETILDRRREMLEQHDAIRRALMWEPRGHADMYGAILTDSVSEQADYGILFMHNEGYSTMCGHGIIAVTTILIEEGLHHVNGSQATIGYDSPAGFIEARAEVNDGGRVTRVAFTNVPSFVFASGLKVETSYGEVQASVVFGGAFYALIDAEAVGLKVEPGQIDELRRYGMEVKHGVEAQMQVVHPLEPGLTGIYGSIICGEPSSEVDGLNVTIFADGEVDRSPCGTGTAARLAWLHATGVLDIGQPFVHESIVGGRFTGTVLETATVGDIPAIIPEIAGRAFITGHHQFTIDPEDPFADGFLVR